eukprot:EG_transcript_9808
MGQPPLLRLLLWLLLWLAAVAAVRPATPPGAVWVTMRHVADHPPSRYLRPQRMRATRVAAPWETAAGERPAVQGVPETTPAVVSEAVWYSGVATAGLLLGGLYGLLRHHQRGLLPDPRGHWTVLTTAAGPGGYQRRQRTNKYANFSKVAHRKLDPQEELEQKAAEFNAAQRRPKRPEGPVKVSGSLKRGAAQAILPDDPNTIDPYDPSSFGFVEVGRIERPHGVNGEVKVRAVTDFGVQRLCTPGLTNVKAPNRRFPRPRMLVRGRKQDKDIYIIKLEGVDTMEEAERLRGHTLFASQIPENRPQLGEEEWMVSDIVGLTVVHHTEQRTLGHVRSILLGDELCAIPGLMQDLLEVELIDFTLGLNQYRTVYVPFVPPIVPVVDLERKEVRVDPPDGLLQLSNVRTKEVIIRGLLPP